MAIDPSVGLLPQRRGSGERAGTGGASFGALLRRHRLAAGLSQEALAERAGLSARAISALEHGERRAPYRATVQALAAALGLTGPERAALEDAVSRSRSPRAAPEPAPNPLPSSPTPFVDRTAEREAALKLLRGDGVRLLTLTGPGGVGKTRLAREVARDLQEDGGAPFPDGVWFVDLAPLRGPECVLDAIAHTLHLHEHERQPLPVALRAHLRASRCLLVLDNFEHLLAAAAQLADLLAACPGLKLLATSRSRLRLRWEHSLPLPPLAVPDATAVHTTEALAAAPAVALFVERARASNPAFALTAANGPAVAALCRHLEGLPLALELAASRAGVLTPAEMLAWAERRLPVLGWDAPDVPARQRSLGATLAWSYVLLPATEQALLRRLAVFAGGWTGAAAEAVTGARELGLDPLEGLTRLSDASLAHARPGEDGQARFGLSETVREFALERLQASGERAPLERRHAAHFRALAVRLRAELRGPRRAAALAAAATERANLRAALTWLARAEPDGQGPAGEPASAPLREVLEALRRAGDGPRRPPPVRPTDPGPTPGPTLTARQGQVAGLIAQGLTNKQIGRALVITEKTVGTHVEGILNTLGFQSRVQVAAWVGGQRAPALAVAHESSACRGARDGSRGVADRDRSRPGGAAQRTP